MLAKLAIFYLLSCYFQQRNENSSYFTLFQCKLFSLLYPSYILFALGSWGIIFYLNRCQWMWLFNDFSILYHYKFYLISCLGALRSLLMVMEANSLRSCYKRIYIASTRKILYVSVCKFVFWLVKTTNLQAGT